MHLDKELYKAAIYLRISRDDEDKSESDSIQNQRDLLKAFIDKDPQIELIDEFVDDGYTGTNFDRPGFMKMMEMVQNDCINCIIVKDLSRLGRNYIETGKYIDKIFPMAGVRFISVNDNYDSCRGFNDADQIVIPFKNLINDSYCRDISMKIRSQLDIKRKNGKFIGAWAGYGYKKDPNDKTHLIIDEPAAEIVKLIFNMKLEGYSASKIADYLNEMGVLTPLQYKRSLGMNCNVGYWKGDNPHWVSPMVGRILKNELYIGNLAQGKCRKINYKVKKNVPVDESEWIKVAGTHEPIVSRAVFDAVQRVLARDTRTSPHEEKVGIFSGIAVCGDCGQNMIRRTKRSKNKDYHYLSCSTARTTGNCTYHEINADKLEQAVLAAVQLHYDLLLKVDELTGTIDEAPYMRHRVKLIDDQISSLNREIQRHKEMKEKAYEDYIDGLLDLEEYEDLRTRFSSNAENCKKTKENLEMKRKNICNEPLLPPAWMEEVRQLGHITKLDRKTIVMLIDKIIVYGRDRIEIIFNYSDELYRAAEMMQGPSIEKRGVIAV